MTETTELEAPATPRNGRAARWQERKSAEMRLRILRTAVDCLVEEGYAGFAVQQIAKRAGISRGALLHHFPTKRDLVSAVIEHSFYMRIQAFLDAFRRSCAEGNDRVETAVAIHWDNIRTREFAANLELIVAARTDPELRDFLLPEAQRYDSIWADEMKNAFPQWKGDTRMLQLSSDFVTVANLGLLLQPDWDAARVDDVLQLTQKTVGDLYRDYAAKD